MSTQEDSWPFGTHATQFLPSTLKHSSNSRGLTVYFLWDTCNTNPTLWRDTHKHTLKHNINIRGLSALWDTCNTNPSLWRNTHKHTLKHNINSRGLSARRDKCNTNLTTPFETQQQLKRTHCLFPLGHMQHKSYTHKHTLKHNINSRGLTVFCLLATCSIPPYSLKSYYA